MDRRLINTLIINDNDLKCKSESLTLYDLNISHLNFQLEDLEVFDLIIYTGKRGTKILKSKYFKSGKITAG